MALTLYQFAISHYSEKVRWALDYKGIRYTPAYLLPGMHVKTIRGLTGQKPTTVPVLVDDQEVIQGSGKILDYLDSRFPDTPLLPDEPGQREAALEWERRLDAEAGPAVITFVYHHLLQRPKVMAPLMAAQLPFWNQYLLRLGFSRVEEIMRKRMNITEKTAAQSQTKVEALLTEINGIYESGRYLAGDCFSRADITAGALFAPLFLPEQYPVPKPKPERLPPGLKAWHQTSGHLLQPVVACYHNHRGKRSA